MKILQIANGDFFSTFGGGQVYVKNLVDEMIRQGLDVTVLSFVNKKSNVPYQKQNYKGINLYEVYQKDEQQLKTLIRQIAPDIIHSHAEKALIARISRELSIRDVVTAHHGGITCPAGTLLNHKDEICKTKVCQEECLPCVLKNAKCGYALYPVLKRISESLRLKTSRLFRKLPFIYYISPIAYSPTTIEEKMRQWKMIAENVSLVIAPSHAIAENMMLNGLDAEKIEIVPHGIPINPIKNNIFVPDIRNHAVKFFYVGRIDYVKGIHILLEAFVKLKAGKCELHIIGDVGNRYAKKLIKQYSEDRNIVFHGKVAPEAVVSKIKEYDILVHPAIYLEVFGLNISEALAEGKPVIATRCGGAEMQIKDKENGLLVAPNDTEELFKAMDWAANHPEDVRKMAEKAPFNVISLQKHIEIIGEVYYKIK